MCGIAGAVGWRDQKSIERTIADMKTAIRHRGPDGHGYWAEADHKVAMGHQRLAIIDLAPSSNQPFVSHDESSIIVFNGEIYNYLELRRELEALGSVFKSHSDTEVILEAYRHWGVHSLKRFKGMWAFALYDLKQRLLFLARDPFGIKPLYYGILDGVLYFGSEPKAIRAVDSRFSEPDETTLRLFQESGYLDRGDWTFFSRIKRFPQGHFALVSPLLPDKALGFTPYWLPPAMILNIGMDDAASEIHRLLRNSVSLHMRSDVPVGSCLSGGIDSSAIVCMASNLLGAGQHFSTFTTHYPNDPEIDETSWAKEVIQYAGASPRFIEPNFEEFMRDFSNLVTTQDEPFGSTSIYAQYAIFKGIAKTNVKVILDGQGADEQLAGYHGFLPAFFNDALKKNHSGTYLREMAYLYLFGKNTVKPSWLRFARSLSAPASPLVDLQSFSQTSFLVDEYESRLKLLRRPEASFEETLQNLVVESNLPQLLRYEDRNSMAHSIESRVPFLDTELVDFTLSLPATLKIHKGLTKAVLREALKGVIPEGVRTRRDKMGFPAPDAKWLAKGFGLQDATPGSLPWRNMVTKVWKEGVDGNQAA